MERSSRNAYFMSMAIAASSLATCPRRKVGAVLVKEKRIVSTGYNGSPSGYTNCFCVNRETNFDEKRTCMHENHCVNTIHAEINALLRAREMCDELFCTDTPCIACLKAALSHNPKIKIWYLRTYEDPAREHFLKEHNAYDRVQRISEEDIIELRKITEYIHDF